MRMQITLKSGAQIEVDVEEFGTNKDVLTDTFTKLNWTTPDGWTSKLHGIVLADISAIVALDGAA